MKNLLKKAALVTGLIASLSFSAHAGIMEVDTNVFYDDVANQSYGFVLGDLNDTITSVSSQVPTGARILNGTDVSNFFNNYFNTTFTTFNFTGDRIQALPQIVSATLWSTLKDDFNIGVTSIGREFIDIFADMGNSQFSNVRAIYDPSRSTFQYMNFLDRLPASHVRGTNFAVGFVADGNIAEVPEQSTIMLFGLSIAGIAVMRQKKMKQRV